MFLFVDLIYGICIRVAKQLESMVVLTEIQVKCIRVVGGVITVNVPTVFALISSQCA